MDHSRLSDRILFFVKQVLTVETYLEGERLRSLYLNQKYIPYIYFREQLVFILLLYWVLCSVGW